MTQDSYLQYVSYIKMFGNLTLSEAKQLLEETRLQLNYEVASSRIRLMQLRARAIQQFIVLIHNSETFSVKLPPEQAIQQMNDAEIIAFFNSGYTTAAEHIMQRIKMRKEIEELTNGITI